MKVNDYRKSAVNNGAIREDQLVIVTYRLLIVTYRLLIVNIVDTHLDVSMKIAAISCGDDAQN